jgi:hypothetical protein
MEQHVSKNVNNCLNTNIYSYLETYGGQGSNLYLKAVIFSTLVLIRHLWQLKTVLFWHWCLIHALLLCRIICFMAEPISSKSWNVKCCHLTLCLQLEGLFHRHLINILINGTYD